MTTPICPTCLDEGWVCENHQDKPWTPAGCRCGAGAPCPACNPYDKETLPRMPEGTRLIIDRDKGYLQ